MGSATISNEGKVTERFKFDPKKGLEVLLYISQKSGNMYNALKVLYFADKEHLEKYGRLICGESYVAMREGPVPSGLYDIIKYRRGEGIPIFAEIPIDASFSMDGYLIIPNREPDLDYLSASDVECLDAAIVKYGDMSFSSLKRLSHDEAYKSADQNDFISLESLIKTLPSSVQLLAHLNE